MKVRLAFPWLASLALLTTPVQAQDWASDFGGHIKGQVTSSQLPEDSLFRDLAGSEMTDLAGELRLKFATRRDRWDFKADYQFIALHADSLALARGLPGLALPIQGVIDDDRRWFDLTDTIHDQGNEAVVQRLDRLSVGLTTERTAWRFGRQAITWGNGLVFTPMDIFNPFDPAAVDKEYKPGDDMLYGQVLFGNGDDLQGVAVVRRDPSTGDTAADQSSLAFKYHGFAGRWEYDLLAAEHFDDQVLGLGGNLSAGGAIWRGDLTWTRTATQEVLSATASASYSWTWSGRNVSGFLEYYRNGFGQPSGDYSPNDLLQNPDLLNRLARGEVYTLARNYLAASASVEMTPLWMLTPTVFLNLDDPSALAQVVCRYDWRQNLTVLAALNLPLGPSGSEYGGIESGRPGRDLSTGPGLFAQLAWYF